MDERATKIADLLHEAAETHHIVFRITDGDDPDWASWYSWWLANHSELSQLLGNAIVPSEITYLLVKLDKEFVATSPAGRWEDYYAAKLIEYFM